MRRWPTHHQLRERTEGLAKTAEEPPEDEVRTQVPEVRSEDSPASGERPAGQTADYERRGHQAMRRIVFLLWKQKRIRRQEVQAGEDQGEEVFCDLLGRKRTAGTIFLQGRRTQALQLPVRVSRRKKARVSRLWLVCLLFRTAIYLAISQSFSEGSSSL